MSIRRQPKMSIWLIPFYAVFLIAGAVVLLLWAFTMSGVTIYKAVKSHKAAKPARPVKAKSRDDREIEAIADRWENDVKPKSKGQTEARWRGPTKDSDGTRVVHKVGGKRVLGRIVDIDELADERPAPPEPVLVGADEHKGWEKF